MQQSAEVICDSIGPNGKRITTFLINHWRGIHAELLRHRLFSFSVASSRAIPYKAQRKQVEEDPMMPCLWPKYHKGMQGKEVFTPAPHSSNDVHNEDNEQLWLTCRNSSLHFSDKLTDMGVSKQLTNRLLEPWVNTRAVVTATEWDNFFMLRHPWIKANAYEDAPETFEWEDKVNLNFPAEYNIQDLAIKMKKALDESEPVEFHNDGWHLPFIEEHEKPKFGDAKHWSEEQWKEHEDKMVKISAARCARTSYGKNIGKTIESELELAEMLLKDKHLSPFEHQAKSLGEQYKNVGGISVTDKIPEGCELRIKENKQGSGRDVELWSRNFKGWTQARALLD